MDESAPPVNLTENNNRNRFLASSKSYHLFNIKRNYFYNSSISKNKINNKSKKKKDNIKIKNVEKEPYKVNIAIDTEKLELLKQKNLVELIQLLEFTCDIFLNDSRYVNKTCNIFKIIKNKEKRRYEIIIDNKKEEEERQNGEQKNDEDENEEEEYYENKEEEEDEEEEDYNDDINIKNKISNKNSFYKENSVKSVINFKTINLNSKNKKNRINIVINNKHNDYRRENNEKRIINDKTFDFNKTYSISWRRTNVLDEIDNKTIWNNPPPIPKIINDSESENNEEEEEEEDENINEIRKRNYKHFKCTDCDLRYNTIEEMTKHHYNIHDKNKIKERKKAEKERKKSRKRENDMKFETWAENRIGKKYSHNNINPQNKNIYKKEINEAEDQAIFDEEEERIKEKFQFNLEKINKNKGLKIGKIMKDITRKRKIIINNLKEEFELDYEADLNNNVINQGLNQIIKDIREKELKKINDEADKEIKILERERNMEFEELRIKKKKYEEQKRQEEERRRKLEEMRRKQEEEERRRKIEEMKNEEKTRRRKKKKNGRIKEKTRRRKEEEV